MSVVKAVTENLNSAIQATLGASPGSGRARSTGDVERALEQMLVQGGRAPTCIVAEGSRFATDHFQARLARDPLLEPRRTRLPLVAIQLTRPVTSMALSTVLYETLTGTEVGDKRVPLHHLQDKLVRRNTSVIAIDGFHNALVGQSFEERTHLIEMLISLLTPKWPAEPINLVVTGVGLKSIFSRADRFRNRSKLILLNLDDAYGDDDRISTDALTHFIAFGNTCWGKGETIEEAVALMERGNDFSDPRYVVYRVHNSCFVTEYGAFRQDAGTELPQRCLDRMQVSNTSSIDECP